MKSAFAIGCLSSAVMVLGCGFESPSEPILCPADFRPGIEVFVYDAITGDPAADDAEGYAQDGDYIDTLLVGGTTGDGTGVSLLGAFERPGVYRVLIRKSGYTDWIATGVRVEGGICGVSTTKLEARLERDAADTTGEA